VPAPKPKSASDVRFGLTLERRKALAWEEAGKEDKAMVEAEMKYPTNLMNGGSEDNVLPNAEYNTKLTEKYQAAICKKYHITYDQLLSILVEAADKKWPLPEVPDLSKLP
jgi:hypothetical protein